LKEQLHAYIKNTLTQTEDFSSFQSMSSRELMKHIGYEVFFLNIFEDTPTSDEIVMFFPLKAAPGSKKPFYTTVPLSEITNA
jgi:hypothetical protein